MSVSPPGAADTAGGLLRTFIVKSFVDPATGKLSVYKGLVYRFDPMSQYYSVLYEDSDTEDMPASEVRERTTGACPATEAQLLDVVGPWVSTTIEYVSTGRDLGYLGDLKPGSRYLLDIMETRYQSGSTGVHTWNGKGFVPTHVCVHDDTGQKVSYRHNGAITKNKDEIEMVQELDIRASLCFVPELYVRPSPKRKRGDSNSSEEEGAE